jgi:hypothetical protein
MAQGSLYQRLARIPDPRCRQGRRHPLAAILTLLSVAMLSGCRSLSAVGQFGRDSARAGPNAGFYAGKAALLQLAALSFEGASKNR